MLQLLWLYWLLTLEAFRKHPCLPSSSVLDEDSSAGRADPQNGHVPSSDALFDIGVQGLCVGKGELGAYDKVPSSS